MAETRTDEEKRQRSKRTWIVVLVVVAFLLLLCACVAATLAVVSVRNMGDTRIASFIARHGGFLAGDTEAQRQVEQTFTVSDVPTIVVDNRVGSVEVVAGDDGQVVVTATARAWGANQDAAQQLADAITVDVAQATPDRIEITASTSGSFTGAHPPQVDIQVQVPHQCRLTITNHVGSVTVRDVAGVVDVKVATGEIQVENLVMTGDCSLSTDLGSLQVSMPRDSSFYLDAHTSLGAITSAFTMSDGGQTQRGMQQGLAGAVGDDPTSTLTLRVATGEITLRASDQ